MAAAAGSSRDEPAGSRQFVRWLVVLLVVEGVVAFLLRSWNTYRFLQGERSATLPNIVGMFGLLLIPAIIWALVGTYRMQHRLSQSVHVLRQELSSAEVTREWIWNIDQAGRITYSNAAVEWMLGYEKDEVIGRTGFDLMKPDDAAEARELLSGLILQKEGWSDIQFRLQHKDGSIRVLESSSIPILNTKNELRGWRGSSREVRPGLQEIEVLRSKHERIRRMIDQQSMRILFQPIVNLETGRMVGVEALARFPGSEYGPAFWFAEAREVGLGQELEGLAIRLALKEFPKLPEDVYISVNVSPDTLLQRDLHSLLQAPEAPPDRVVVEVTEHATIEDYEEASEIIRSAQELGIRAAVDDAGAGYASFQHILRLRPDFVKIDRSLTTMIHEDPARRALAAAMVSFADSVQAQVIAEGMETLEEVAKMHQTGVAYGQGYYFMHPSPIGELRRDYDLARWAELAVE